MVIDDLDLIRVTRAKHETNAVLIVNSDTPLTGSISFEFFQPVARRHSQESDFGGRINKQQLSPGPSRELRWHNFISLTIK